VFLLSLVVLGLNFPWALGPVLRRGAFVSLRARLSLYHVTFSCHFGPFFLWGQCLQRGAFIPLRTPLSPYHVNAYFEVSVMLLPPWRAAFYTRIWAVEPKLRCILTSPLHHLGPNFIDVFRGASSSISCDSSKMLHLCSLVREGSIVVEREAEGSRHVMTPT
jgi:hypothetical protein